MRKPLAIALAVALVSGCTVGPQHVRPEMELGERFDQAADQAAEPLSSALWSSFRSPGLDTLIARAVEANTSLAQAASRLAETRALAGLSVYSLFPTVTAAADAERSQPSGRDPFLPADQGRTDTYRAGFDASWEIDLFGSLRNQKRAILQRVDADAAALRDARLAVVAEVAQAWFALQGARQQLALRQRQIGNLEHNLKLLQAMFEAGRVTALDVARAETQLRSLAAQKPADEAELSRHEQRLAVLTAWPVATLRQQVGDSVEPQVMPILTTLGTPREWLLRRPDIEAAERRLAAARSDVGYEQAQYFPILSLLGDAGWTATSFSGLGGQSSERWSFGPSLSWRFLDFGRVRQNVRAAEARVDGAVAAYQETVLRALEETENALAGLRAANQRAVELDAAVVAADRALELVRLRFEAGAVSYLEVLDAERTQLDLHSQQLAARTAQGTALAALYKALAGDFAEASSG